MINFSIKRSNCHFVRRLVLLTILSIWKTTVIADELRHIVIISGGHSAPYEQVSASFTSHFKESEKVSIETKYLQKDPKLSAELMNWLANNDPDLIVTLGSKATRLVANQITVIPIIAGLVMNSEIIADIPNASGVTLEHPIAVQLGLLQRILPNKKKVGVLYNPSENHERINLAETEAKRLGLTLVPVMVNSPRDLPSALEQIAKQANVLWSIPDQTVMSSKTIQAVMLSSFRNRIPFVGLSSPWVKAGALYAMGWDYQDLGIQCAELAMEVLDGKPVNQIQIANPRMNQFSINLKTVNHMKLDLSAHLVANAAQVYD